jgi:hypothetical protein
MGLGSSHLVPAYGAELEQQIAKTKPGMAHYAGTGPFARTCGECVFKGYRRDSSRGVFDPNSGEMIYRSYRVGGCEKYMKLTGIHGPVIEGTNEACKYFEANK